MIGKNIPEKKNLVAAFADWMPGATLSNRNAAQPTDEQLTALLRARTAGATPSELAEICRLSVYKVHKLLNYAKNKNLDSGDKK